MVSSTPVALCGDLWPAEQQPRGLPLCEDRSPRSADSE
ncbi:DUF3039 domain-containing protein [Streptomyces sp. NPDC058953]